MSKGLRGFVDDALPRTGPLAVEKSDDLSTTRPFAHQLHRALFVLYRIQESQNPPRYRSIDHNLQGSTYPGAFPVQTSGATSFGSQQAMAYTAVGSNLLKERLYRVVTGI